MQNTPNSSVPSVSPSSPSIPSYSRSYKKTIFAKPTSPKPKRLGYNKIEHFNLIKDYDAPASSNGVALINNSHCICILNTGLPTRVTGPSEGASAPDLSLCSPDLASTLDWYPLTSSYGSDHFPLVITFPSQKPIKTTRSPRFKYRLNNADWELFNQRVEQRTTTYSEEGSQISAEILSQVLIETADESFCTKTKSFASLVGS
ncbi:unnamed protein product [Pieris brassicae]|uniref:Endonuclease/exonuclease/phosphatase domain-containing protein n=1 Tax=Pieris brassicae TaxID=7116 RepID=A0A9P0TUJ4_PIEBR|nr:unnamed protein product [Pieris brassicae]